MPKSLQAALIPLFIMVMTGIAVKLGVDAKSLLSIQLAFWAIAFMLAAVTVAGWGWVMNHLQAKTVEIQTKKIETAETIVPGITQVVLPENPEIQASVTVNDPATPDPPLTLTNPPSTPPTPSGGPS